VPQKSSSTHQHIQLVFNTSLVPPGVAHQHHRHRCIGMWKSSVPLYDRITLLNAPERGLVVLPTARRFLGPCCTAGALLVDLARLRGPPVSRPRFRWETVDARNINFNVEMSGTYARSALTESLTDGEIFEGQMCLTMTPHKRLCQSRKFNRRMREERAWHSALAEACRA
jgi:hypothetical protein